MSDSVTNIVRMKWLSYLDAVRTVRSLSPHPISDALFTSKEIHMANTTKMRRIMDLQNEFDDALGDYPVMLTVPQVARLLNISKSSVFRLLKTGALERVRFNMTGQAQSSVRIPAESVSSLFTSWLGDSDD